MPRTGRPKSKDGGKVLYTFRLDPKTAEKVERLAERTTLGRSTLLRLLVEKALRHFEEDQQLVRPEPKPAAGLKALSSWKESK